MFTFKSDTGQEISVECPTACALLTRWITLRDCFEELAQEVKGKKEREAFEFAAEQMESELNEFIFEITSGAIPGPSSDPQRN